MSTKLLDLFFRIGRFLSITPFYDQIVTLPQQIYTYIFVILNMIMSFVSIYFRNQYETSYAKTIVLIMMDINLIIFTSYIGLSVVFWNKTSWEKLMRNLLAIISLTENPSKIKREILISMVQLLVALCILILEYTFWVNSIFSSEQFATHYSVRYIPYYIFFSYNVFVSFILFVIANRYQQFKLTFSKIASKPTICTTEITSTLGTIEHGLHLQKHTVDLFNKIFGWSTALAIIYMILYILNNVDYIFMTPTETKEKIEQRIFADSVLVLSTMIGPFLTIIRCDSSLKEVEDLLSMAYDMQMSCKNPTEKARLEEFVKIVDRNFPKFSVARFFFIDRSSILNILGCVATFTIVMIQFRVSTFNTGM